MEISLWIVLLLTSYHLDAFNIHRDEQGLKRNHKRTQDCPTQEDIITVKDIQNALMVSKFAYSDDLKNGNTVPGTSFIVNFIYEDNLFDDGAGIKVIMAVQGSTTIVAYRGTDGTKQLLRQGLAAIKKYTGDKYPIQGEKNSRVNTFFKNAFELLFPAIRYRLLDQSRRYILTGHSLGGALATLLAIKMAVEDNGKMWENPRTCLITFGAPRVGNKAFAKIHDSLIPTYKKLRFIANRDPVPHIPLWPTFLHHSREILLDDENYGSFLSPKYRPYWRVCNKEEELMCSNFYTLTLKLSDHNIETYEKYIMTPPNIFKDRKKHNKNTFEEAITSSCLSGGRKRSQVVEDKIMQLTKRVLVAMNTNI